MTQSNKTNFPPHTWPSPVLGGCPEHFCPSPRAAARTSHNTCISIFSLHTPTFAWPPCLQGTLAWREGSGCRGAGPAALNLTLSLGSCSCGFPVCEWDSRDSHFPRNLTTVSEFAQGTNGPLYTQSAQGSESGQGPAPHPTSCPSGDSGAGSSPLGQGRRGGEWPCEHWQLGGEQNQSVTLSDTVSLGGEWSSVYPGAHMKVATGTWTRPWSCG